jgi:hypothetical protein
MVKGTGLKETLALDFEVLSERLDRVMYQQSKHVWMKQMAEQQ